jgi:hypothetical protein
MRNFAKRVASFGAVVVFFSTSPNACNALRAQGKIVPSVARVVLSDGEQPQNAVQATAIPVQPEAPPPPGAVADVLTVGQKVLFHIFTAGNGRERVDSDQELPGKVHRVPYPGENTYVVEIEFRGPDQTCCICKSDALAYGQKYTMAPPNTSYYAEILRSMGNEEYDVAVAWQRCWDKLRLFFFSFVWLAALGIIGGLICGFAGIY